MFRKVKVLGRMLRARAKQMGLTEDDLVFVVVKEPVTCPPEYIMEKVDCSPVEFLERKFFGKEPDKEPDRPVTLEWETLEAVANYYQFPKAVFFLPKEYWAKRGEDTTRLSELQEKAEKLERIEEILGEGQ